MVRRIIINIIIIMAINFKLRLKITQTIQRARTHESRGVTEDAAEEKC